jgi:hypothetical protein
MTSDERVLQYVADANPIPDPHRMLDLRSFESVDLTERRTRRRRAMQTTERERLREVPDAPARRPRWAVALAAAAVVLVAGVGSWWFLAGGGGDAAGPTEEEMMAAIETETALFEAGDWEGWSTFVDPAVYSEDTGIGSGELTWMTGMGQGRESGYALIDRDCRVVGDLLIECIGTGVDNFYTPAGYSFEDIRVYEFNDDGAIIRINHMYTASVFMDKNLDMNNLEAGYLRWLEEAYPDLFSSFDVNTRLLYTFPGWVEGREGEFEAATAYIDEFLEQSDKYPVAPVTLDAPDLPRHPALLGN